jgi:hypothetical protein
VIGTSFPQSLLEKVAALSAVELAARLSALRQGQFLYEQALFPEAVYAFKHPLTQEVAYKSQLAARRAETHGAVARAIAELYPDKLDERAALLAHHSECAARWEEAARWHARAADWAGANDPGETLRHWMKVRELLRHVPESDGTATLALSAHAKIIQFAFYQGLAADQVRATLAEGRQLAERMRNPGALANLLMQYALVLWTGDAPRAALEPLEEARKLADSIGDPVTRVGARMGSLLLASSSWASSGCPPVERRKP